MLCSWIVFSQATNAASSLPSNLGNRTTDRHVCCTRSLASIRAAKGESRCRAARTFRYAVLAQQLARRVGIARAGTEQKIENDRRTGCHGRYLELAMLVGPMRRRLGHHQANEISKNCPTWTAIRKML